MKKYLFSSMLAFAVLFSGNSQAELSQYTESGSDSQGDSFSLTFKWDSIEKSITQVMAGSFVDMGGVYQNVTQLVTSLATGNGTVNVLITDDSFNGVVLYLTANAVPTPSSVDTGFYAVTTSLTNPGVFYANQPTITAIIMPNAPTVTVGVPEPQEWVMFLLGLALISVWQRKKPLTSNLVFA